MYFYNDQILASGVVIGGGLDTPAHAKDKILEPDSYRLDFVTDAMHNCIVDSMDFVTSGFNYAVYKFTVGTTNYFMFYVEIKSFVKGRILRGQRVCEGNGKWIHIHVKKDGYSPKNHAYLHYLPFFDPKVKITTNFGSNAYTGLNVGEQIPGLIINNTEMIHLQTQIVCKTINTKPIGLKQNPSLSSPDIGTVNPSIVFGCNRLATGDAVNGNTTWYGMGSGWINVVNIQEQLPTSDQDTIKALQKRIDDADKILRS